MAGTDSGEERKISWEELKEHNSKSKKAWVAIKNKVYDVTEFMDDVSVHCMGSSAPEPSVRLFRPLSCSILAAKRYFWSKQVRSIRINKSYLDCIH